MLTIKEILSATNGKLLSGIPEGKLSGIFIDSRKTKKGSLFIAIKGERFDGHAFIRKALEKGAKALIVSKDIPKVNPQICVIQVKDTRKALCAIAQYYRSLFDIPVLAVTGSVGKTTAKEMIACVLGGKYCVLKNDATQNNEIGVSLTLLKLRKKHHIAVVELGTNHFGEIRRLAKMIRPTGAVFLNVGESHLKFLKTVKGVFNEKSSLLEEASEKGLVVYNKDDRWLCQLPSNAKKPFHWVSFSVEKRSNFRAEKIKRRNNFLQFYVHNKKFCIKTVAFHNIYNALAAIVCGTNFGVSFSSMARLLNNIRLPNGRMRIRRIKGCIVMDDTYNANPISFGAAIESFSSYETPGRKILVCADMLELGRKTESLHRRLGRLIAKKQFAYVFTVGSAASYIAKEIKRHKPQGMQIFHKKINASLKQHLCRILRKGDAILLKGSRGMHLEEVIYSLEKRLNVKK